VGDGRDVRRHIKSLNARYQEQGSSFRIEEIAGGFRMMTLPAYNRWLVKLLRVRQETKLSAAAMETLAIVAYKQPCTRADIEAIRGVAAGDVLNRLREMNLVKIVGRAEDLGRPMLYGTTKRFLEVFGLPGLEDLPQVEALRSGATAGPSQTARPDDKTNEKAADGPTATETDSSAQPPGRKRRGKNKPAESDEGQPDQTGIAASAAIANGEPHSLEHPPERAVVMPNGTPIMRLTNDEDAGDVIDEVDDDAGASDALPDEDDVSDEGDE
jgi:segregation and condensation protein B